MKYVKSLALAGLLVMGMVLVGCSSDDDDGSSDASPVATSTSSAPSNTPNDAGPTGADSSGAEAATIELVAKSLKFDKDEITVPANTEVTVVLDNQDASVPHNFSVYETEDAADEIFKGELVTGVASVNETFTSPDPGEYFFRCDVHPDTMTGTFIVE